MKRLLFLLIFTSAIIQRMPAQQIMSWEDAYRKADEYIGRLTDKEKIRMTYGYNKFFFPGVPEKGIPYVFTANATNGLRMTYNMPDLSMVEVRDTTTAFPAPIMLSATFNPDLTAEYARNVGVECRAAGVEVLLGPGVNMYRNAQCGRNFEYFGEDPYLASRMMEAYVPALQSTGTMACLKHFLVNNTEYYRHRSNSIVDERAIMEIYTPGFKAGIDAGAGSVMTSYNQLNGEWCGESKTAITDLLRGRLGFRGLVMTDWDSVYDWEKIIRSGQNIDMPGWDRFYMTVKPEELYEQGKITIEEVENMIRPHIATCIAFGLYDRAQAADRTKPELWKEVLPEHAKTSYNVAKEGIVLLKNNGILPLKENAKILFTGKYMNHLPTGGGSARVRGYSLVTPVAAFRAAFWPNISFVENPTDEELTSADVVICTTGTYDSETLERPFALPADDEKFIKRVIGCNSNTVVIVNSGSGIRMTDWADKAAAVIYGWYPGMNGYRAIADVVSGAVNPSGKLPMTIEREFADSPARNTMPKGAEFYAKDTNEHFIQLYDVHYDESVLIGYRWYETKGIEPLFPFGYGLSYTSFELSKANLSSKTISDDKPVKAYITVKNNGDREGAEVVQLYVSEKNPTVLRPKKELKGFKKVYLPAGRSAVVELEISHGDLAFWCDKSHAWTVNPGEYIISLGTSSADIKAELNLTAK